MTKLDNTKPEPPRVPTTYPYGSITDGTRVCIRCLEPVTGCALCAGEYIHLKEIWRYK